jgi:hypothetical protein
MIAEKAPNEENSSRDDFSGRSPILRRHETAFLNEMQAADGL